MICLWCRHWSSLCVSWKLDEAHWIILEITGKDYWKTVGWYSVSHRTSDMTLKYWYLVYLLRHFPRFLPQLNPRSTVIYKSSYISPLELELHTRMGWQMSPYLSSSYWFRRYGVGKLLFSSNKKERAANHSVQENNIYNKRNARTWGGENNGSWS